MKLFVPEFGQISACNIERYNNSKRLHAPHDDNSFHAFWGPMLQHRFYEFSKDLELPPWPGQLIISLEDGSTLDYVVEFSMNGYLKRIVSKGYKIKTIEAYYYTMDFLLYPINESKENIKAKPLF